MAKKDGKPKKDRGAARRAKAAARAGTRPSPGARTPSQDAANAWRQGVSEATADTVDQMAAHVQTVALQQLEDRARQLEVEAAPVDRLGSGRGEAWVGDHEATALGRAVQMREERRHRLGRVGAQQQHGVR